VNFGRKPRKLDAAALLGYGLKLLHGRSLSAGELRQKLAAKAERLDDMDPVLSRLREYGFVDDRKFAENFAAARADGGLGKARVLRYLRQRRVSSTVAQSTVDEAFRDRNEVEMIEAYLARKFRNVNLSAHLADEKKLASAYRRLRYAGFGSANAIRVLKKYAVRAAELEDEGGETV
jgi:regulatory protein